MAAAIAVLMVCKMLYQIKYIDHNNWNVNCTVIDLFYHLLLKKKK